MDKDLKYSIFEETDCLSEQTLFDYIDKKLSPKENHAVEKHLLHCELCSDALEGLGMVKDRKRIATINTDISLKLASSAEEEDKKVVVFNYKVVVAVAASLLLLVGGVFFFTMMNKEKSMAVYSPADSFSETPPPPPPPASELSLEEEPETMEKPVTSAVKDEVAKEVPVEIEGAIEEKKPEYKMQKGKVETDVTKDDLTNNLSRNPLGGMGNSVSGNSNYPANTISSATTLPYSPQAKTGEQNKFAESLDDEIVVDAKKSVNGEPGFKSYSPVKATGDEDSNSKVSQTLITKNLANNDKEDRKEKASKKTERAREKEVGANESVAVAAPVSTSQAEEQNVTAADGAGGALSNDVSVLSSEPVFPGGIDAFNLFVRNNFDSAIFSKNQQLLQHLIRLEFVVNKDGVIKNIVIIDKTNTTVDNELKRVLKSMPKWQPATESGSLVSKKVTTSIKLIK